MTGKIKKATEKGYIGSVRFFKNLIFLSICVLIAIPTALAVKYYRVVSTAQEPAVAEAEPAFAPAVDSMEPFEPYEDTVVPETTDIVSEEPPAYQALYPDFYAPQPYEATERVENAVYLTFSDGPSEQTDEILAILAEKEVKATFFVVGCNEEGDERRLRDIAEQGHTLGMHAYSHDYTKLYASVEDFLSELYKNYEEIIDVAGVGPTVFRFPGGSINAYNAGFYQELIDEMVRRGFVPFDANVSAEDANSGNTAEELVEHVMSDMAGLKRGVVLLHDSAGKKSTVEALPMIIDQLRGQGYAFLAITPETMPVLYASG